MINNKKIKSILCGVILTLGFTTIVGCGAGNVENAKIKNEPKVKSQKGVELDKIKKSGKLVLGTCADYPPYEFHKINNKSDEIIGFDIEIAKAIAKDLGVQLEIKDMDFEGLIPSLKTGKVDILIAGMTPDEDKKKEVDFSKIYYKAKQSIVIRKSDKEKLKNIKDLEEKKVGAQMASLQEKLVKSDIKGAQLVSLGKVTDLILSLKTKKIDAIVVEGPVAEAYVRNNPELMVVNAVIGKSDDGSAIAIQKGSKEFVEAVNKTVDNLIQKKEIDKMVGKASEELVNVNK